MNKRYEYDIYHDETRIFVGIYIRLNKFIILFLDECESNQDSTMYDKLLIFSSSNHALRGYIMVALH